MSSASIEELLARAPDAPAPGRALLRDEVYTRIRTWIVEGLLPPETKLRDGEIAEALAVSRMPVREAIRRLQDEGFVVAAASRWTKVSPIDPHKAASLYSIVWALERLAVSLSQGWNAERISGLRAANLRLSTALAAEDAVAASDADTDFHQQIVDASGNTELQAIIERLKTQLRRIEIAYFDGRFAGTRSVAEHDLIINELEAGDLDAAGAALEQNWRESLQRLNQRLRNQQEAE